MKAKLIKTEKGFALVSADKTQPIASTLNPHDSLKLSLKNCQAIERGYDLDELADEYGFRVPYDGTKDFYDLEAIKHYKAGFQKALGILGDKRFTDKDLDKAIEYGHKSRMPFNEDWYDEFIQSLQQTEWEVEIIMKDNFESDGIEIVNIPKPKLDADGCLILKRVV